MEQNHCLLGDNEPPSWDQHHGSAPACYAKLAVSGSTGTFLIQSSAIRYFLCALPSHTTPRAPLSFFTAHLISCQRTGTTATISKLLPGKLQGVHKLGLPVGRNFKVGCSFQDQQLFCFNSFYRLICSALAWI